MLPVGMLLVAASIRGAESRLPVTMFKVKTVDVQHSSMLIEPYVPPTFEVMWEDVQRVPVEHEVLHCIPSAVVIEKQARYVSLQCKGLGNFLVKEVIFPPE